ncbi:MAG: hypothetical protein A2137_08185 [Chloroflexi bacterium RBG_16_58_8]|nr:MAG: hypothetical protein A2137_08185 [Chloroflexi bacterium RBG_16_58_8]
MKTANIQRAGGDNGRTRPTSFDRVEAIAGGVRARLEESTGYSRKVTDETINIARALGVTDTEIQRWAHHRADRLGQEGERLREIKSLLNRVYGKRLTSATRVPPA